MPQIIVTTADPGRDSSVEVHRERVDSVDVSSDTSSHLLVERIGWALSDAEEIEADGEPVERNGGFSPRSGTITDSAVL